jgi:AcrR family transcriptional regulator
MAIMEPRPLRADARRNREAVLKAAKAVLAKCGPDAQMDDIARKAKVGVGTVYRHFPTKEALIGALMVERFEQITAFIEAGLEDPDPFNGFAQALWRGAELSAKDRASSALFSERVGELEEVRRCTARLNRAAAELIRRAQEAGAMRKDVTVDDVPVFMCGVTQAMHQIDRDPLAWRRHLQLIIDGLRAGPHTTELGSGA